MPPDTNPKSAIGEPRRTSGTKSPAPARIAYSPTEFAGMAGLHPQTVLSAIHAGQIPATKFGRQYRIAAAFVRTFLAEDQAA